MSKWWPIFGEHKKKEVWFVVATVDGKDLDWWGPYQSYAEAKVQGSGVNPYQIVGFREDNK